MDLDAGKVDRQLALLSLDAPLNDAGRDPDEPRRSDERMSMPRDFVPRFSFMPFGKPRYSCCLVPAAASSGASPLLASWLVVA